VFQHNEPEWDKTGRYTIPGKGTSHEPEQMNPNKALWEKDDFTAAEVQSLQRRRYPD
jgi:hypothetical protein